MGYGVTEAQRSLSDVRWWKDNHSSREIAERLARSHVDREGLEHRLAELLEENETLKLQYTAVTVQLAEERQRSYAERAERLNAGGGRREAESAARGRLVQDDLERKVQALQVELNRERHRATKLQEQLANCICGDIQIEHVRHEPLASAAGMPQRWVIRNSR